MKNSLSGSFILAVLSALVMITGASAQQIRLVSETPDNDACQSFNRVETVSDDGRFVFYRSACAEQTPNYRHFGTGNDIVAKDLQTGEIHFVSAAPQRQLVTRARLFDISADGRFALFGGNSGQLYLFSDITDLYLRDLQTATTTRIARLPYWNIQASISGDGEIVAFTNVRENSSSPLIDVWVWHRATGQLERITNPDPGSAPAASGDCRSLKVNDNGRYVFFDSSIDGLVPNDTNGQRDVFRYDVVTGVTLLQSADRDGNGAGNGDSKLREHDFVYGSNVSSHIISGDGRYVVFTSGATNLVAGFNSTGSFVRDNVTGTTTILNLNLAGTEGFLATSDPLISADGSTATFWQRGHIYTYDYGNPPIVFLDRVFVRDLNRLQTSLLNSQYPNNQLRNYDRCTNVDLSGDGRFALYNCRAGNSPELYELFLTDRASQTTTPIDSPSMLYGQGATRATMSRSGRVIAFMSPNRLVPEDTDNANDVYVYQTGFMIGTKSVKR